MVSRFKQRELVLQALYMYDIQKGKINSDILFDFSWDKTIEDKPKEELTFAKNLLTAIVQNIDDIDDIYFKYLDAKKHEKEIGLIDKAILRIAVAEIEFINTEAKIVLDEAMNLSKKYSTEHSYKLLNGILHSYITNKHKI